MTGPAVERLAHKVRTTTARVIEAIEAAGGTLPVDGVPTLEWYTIRDGETQTRNLAGDPPMRVSADRPPTIYIYSEIGGSLGVKASRFKDDLNAIDAPLIHVRINSPGGSLFDGRTIMNVLREHPARIVGFVDGIAASAASIVLLGCDEVVVGPQAEIMIHDASMTVDGNPSELAKSLTFLERESQGIAESYAQRSGKGDAEYWRNLMRDETWLYGDEAIEVGMADRAEELAPRTGGQLAERMAARFDLTCYRYAGRQAAPNYRRFTPSTGRARTVDRPIEPIEARSRLSSNEALTRAAQLRRDAVRPGQGPVARRTSPLGVGASRRVGFPSKMAVALVDFNGQRRYQVSGHASIYEQRYEMWDQHGPYWEVVSRGAGATTLAAKPDVAYLMNHAGVTMARTTNESLKLWEDDGPDVFGLAYDAFLNPKRSDVQLLVTAIEDGDITENSFAFMIPDGGGRWNHDFTEYRIDEYDLDRGDVSSVNYGANPYTDVAARAREILSDLDRLPAGAARVAIDRLEKRIGRPVADLEQFGVYTSDGVAGAPRDMRPVPAQRDVTTEQTRPVIAKGRTLDAIEALLVDLEG